MWFSRLIGLAVTVAVSFTISAQEGRLKYPETKKGEYVDDYHGTKVADPYRWLEDDVRKSKEVADWVEAENKVTDAYLEAIPEREADPQAAHRAVELREVLRPVQGRRPLLLLARTTACRTRPCSTRRTRSTASRGVLLDPNTLVEGRHRRPGRRWRSATTASTSPTASPRPARDWNTWHVLDVATGKPLADELKWVKFSGAVVDARTARASSTAASPSRRRAQTFQSLNLNQKLYYHRLGTPQTEDVLVYKRPDHPKWGIDGDVTEDGRYLVITIGDGTDEPQDPRRLQGPGRAATAMPVDLIDNFDNKYSLRRQRRPGLLLQDRLQGAAAAGSSPSTRASPDRANWKEIIPRRRRTLEQRRPRRQPVRRQLPEGRHRRR